MRSVPESIGGGFGATTVAPLASPRLAPAHSTRGITHGVVQQHAQELLEAKTRLSDVQRAVCVWGSARPPEGSPVYEQAVAIGKLLAENGFAVIHGGGPGVMAGAGAGAQQGGSLSVGLNLRLPFETPSVFQDVELHFEGFGPRNETFMRHGDTGHIILAGGFGTCYEAFMSLTRVQCGKADPRPIIFLEHPERPYWGKLLDWIKTEMLAGGFISSENLDLIQLAHSPEEAMGFLLAYWGKHQG